MSHRKNNRERRKPDRQPETPTLGTLFDWYESAVLQDRSRQAQQAFRATFRLTLLRFGHEATPTASELQGWLRERVMTGQSMLSTANTLRSRLHSVYTRARESKWPKLRNAADVSPFNERPRGHDNRERRSTERRPEPPTLGTLLSWCDRHVLRMSHQAQQRFHATFRLMLLRFGPQATPTAHEVQTWLRERVRRAESTPSTANAMRIRLHFVYTLARELKWPTLRNAADFSLVLEKPRGHEGREQPTVWQVARWFTAFNSDVMRPATLRGYEASLRLLRSAFGREGSPTVLHARGWLGRAVAAGRMTSSTADRHRQQLARIYEDYRVCVWHDTVNSFRATALRRGP